MSEEQSATVRVVCVQCQMQEVEASDMHLAYLVVLSDQQSTVEIRSSQVVHGQVRLG